MRLSTTYVRGARQALTNAEECRADAQAAGMQHLLTFATRDRQHAVSMLEALADVYRQEGKHPLVLRTTELVIKGHVAIIAEEERNLKLETEINTAKSA